MSFTYPKIETLFKRDNATFRVIEGEYRLPEFALVKKWIFTEKIDGVNVRVILNRDGTVRYGGRTDDAQMPPFLLSKLQEMFPAAQVASAFDSQTEAVIFGEGYGPKIQKGGVYRKDVSVRIFDVVVFSENKRPWWLNWADVEDVAAKLHVMTVPEVGVWVGDDSLTWREYVTERKSIVAYLENDSSPENVAAEGIVARTEPLLFTRRGDRVMWKLKGKDFTSGKK